MLLPAFNLLGTASSRTKTMQTRAETNRKVLLCRVPLVFAVIRQRYPPRPGDSGKTHVFEHKVRKKNAIPTVAVH